ncbi:MAG: radical SAM protein, partial [bacterium]
VGGSHATVVPEKAIQKEGVDIICIGQGEKPLLELIQRMEQGRDITNIPSLWIKTSDGKIIKNKIGLQIENMDEIPESDWDLIDEKHRIRPFEGELKNYGWFEISRGCPFNCSYCINSKLHKIELDGGMSPGTYRFFSPEEIIKRMKKYKDKYGFNHVQCIDENMAALPLETLKKFAILYKEYIGCSFFTQSRPECFIVHPEKAKIMAEMGCKMVGLGVESGNEELRRTILNRHIKDGVVEQAVEILKDAGIMVAAYYIIGFPTETKEMIQQTIDLHRRIKPHRFSVRFLHPFPGTQIRKLCVEKGYIKENYEDLRQDASFFAEPVLNLPSPPHPTKEELIELRKEFENY